MKKTMIGMGLLFSLVGCAPINLDDAILTYNDPAGRFRISYPDDWIQTEGGIEIQFWDNLDDGKNSIKMYLIETEFVDFGEIRERDAFGWGPNLHRTFEETTVNGLPALIERGSTEVTEYSAYYYQVGEIILRLIAVYYDDDMAIRMTASEVQRSFRVEDH